MNPPRPPIRVDVALFPYGQYQGIPVLTLDVESDIVLPPKETIISALVQGQATGTNALWIRKAPWGDPVWEETTFDLITNDWLGQMPFLAVRDIGEALWSPHQVQWIADCTALVDFDGREVAQIESRCDALGFRPQLHEIIVRDIHPTQFNAATLDGLARSMRVEQAWIYLHNDEYWRHQGAIMQAISACSSAWGARPWAAEYIAPVA